MKTNHLIVLCLSFVAACGSAPPHEVDVKRVPLSQVMAANTTSAVPKGNLDPAVTIPAHYVARRMTDDVPAVVVGTPADVESVISSGKFSGIAEGVFLISLSMDRAYYPSTGKFDGETSKAAAEIEKAGFTNVRIRRRDAGGVPVLSITAQKDGRPNYLAFVAIGDTGSIMRIKYIPAASATPGDERRWEDFIVGLDPANLR